jgi:hypothetical protein
LASRTVSPANTETCGVASFRPCAAPKSNTAAGDAFQLAATRNCAVLAAPAWRVPENSPTAPHASLIERETAAAQPVCHARGWPDGTPTRVSLTFRSVCHAGAKSLLKMALSAVSAWPLPRVLPAVANFSPSSRPHALASLSAKRRLRTTLVSPAPLSCWPGPSTWRTHASPPTRMPQSGVNASLRV